MDNKINSGGPDRALAVTVIAWVYISFSLYGITTGLRQLSANTVVKLLNAQPLLYIGFNIALLVSAFGVLKRFDLARKALIGLLCLAALMNVGVLVYVKLAFRAIIPLYSLSVVAATTLFFGAGVYALSRKTVIEEFRL